MQAQLDFAVWYQLPIAEYCQSNLCRSCASYPNELIILLLTVLIFCILAGTTVSKFLGNMNRVGSELDFLRQENQQLKEKLESMSAGVDPTNIISESSLAYALSYKTLLLNLPGIVYRCKNDADWTMLILNEGIETITGFSRLDFLDGTRTFASLIHTDDRDKVWDQIQAALHEGRYFEMVYRIYNAQNELLWVWERGRRVFDDSGNQYLEGVINDISPQMKAEIQLKENEKKFRLFFNHIGDALLVFACTENNLPARLIEYNTATPKLLGFSGEELSLKIFTDIFPALSPARFSQFDVLQPIVLDTRIASKDGQMIDVKISACKIDSDNENGQILCSVIDIRNEKRYVEELKEAKQRAEVSDRLKSAFLANISHEIRTPLNSIIGFADVLSKEHLSKEKSAAFARIIKQSGTQLLDIVTSIVDLSKIESGQTKVHKSRITPIDLLLDLLSEYSYRARKDKPGLIIVSDISPSLPDFISDSVLLKRILNNLISNAYRYTGNGKITIRVFLENPYVIFEIDDTGLGIPVYERDYIFERFFRGDNLINQRVSGTGLGLSLSKSLAVLLRGDLVYKPTSGIGSVFQLKIPFEPAKQQNDNKQKFRGVNMNKFNQFNILIAEDLEVNFIYLREVLSELPVKVFHAWNGKEVVEYACKEDIQLVLMDIRMPLQDGIEALKQIKKQKPDLPIIAQTAYAQEGEQDRYISGGFDGFLAKPVRRKELLEKIGEYMRSY